MPIRRLDRDGVGRLLGAPALQRLQNKQQGGNNALKGYRYETLFGAHRIARLLRKYIEHREDAVVEWQSDGFVDDFMVRREARHSVKGYQLKNSNAVTWNGDIESDFRFQHTVSQDEGYTDIRLRLVCSDDATTAALRGSVPQAIAGYSRAFHFPWDPSALAVLAANAWLADDFAFLSRHVAPDIAEVEIVFQILMGAWQLLAPRTEVSLVMQKMRRTSPMMIRTIETDEAARAQLDPDFRTVLDRLPGFKYHIERGFLHWSFGAFTTGTISHDCFAEPFLGLQRHIVDLNPQAFDEIESLMQ